MQRDTNPKRLHTSRNTHISPPFFLFFSSQCCKRGKKSEGCGIGSTWRALCQLSLQQEGDEPAGVQGQERQFRPPLPRRRSRGYASKLVSHVLRCEQREIKRMETSGKNFLGFFHLRCGGVGCSEGTDQVGAANRLQRSACQVVASRVAICVASCVSPISSVQPKPSSSSTPPALRVMHMPG